MTHASPMGIESDFFLCPRLMLIIYFITELKIHRHSFINKIMLFTWWFLD